MAPVPGRTLRCPASVDTGFAIGSMLRLQVPDAEIHLLDAGHFFPGREERRHRESCSRVLSQTFRLIVPRAALATLARL